MYVKLLYENYASTQMSKTPNNNSSQKAIGHFQILSRKIEYKQAYYCVVILINRMEMDDKLALLY
jgi:hypothetical protein